MLRSLFDQSELKDLIQQVEQGERLGYIEGVRLMKSKDILALGYMANLMRERKNSDRTYFTVNLPINYADIYRETAQDATGTEKRTNVGIVYGQTETVEDRVKQILALRDLQDRKREFLTFSPLPFHPLDTPIEGTMGVPNTTGFEDLRMLAVCRILLDNFDHIRTYWLLLGPKLAQVSLNFGVDDLDGTVIDEQSKRTIGAMPEQAMSKRLLIRLIHKAGRQALERDAHYHVLNDYGLEGGIQR